MDAAPAINGPALRDAREAAGLTQADLARAIGVVGGERISMWERGLARPRNPRLLHAAAAAVGVPATFLLEASADGPTMRWLRFAAGLERIAGSPGGARFSDIAQKGGRLTALAGPHLRPCSELSPSRWEPNPPRSRQLCANANNSGRNEP